jgi:hypothetical protein
MPPLWRCQSRDALQHSAAVIRLPLTAAFLGCGLLLAPMTARAAVLIHEYALRGSLDDTLGGSPLTALGGQITALGYVFAANQGLSFSSREFTPQNYSVELSFRLDAVSGSTKLIDFHNLTKDPGLYQHNGTLQFSPLASAGVSDFSPGANMHVVLTRDGATGLVTAYVNGEQRFSFLDLETLSAVPGFSNKLNFFVDEKSNESGGLVNYLRIFNGALSAGEVSALFAAGPPVVIAEPPAFALLAGGAILAWLSRRIRRRR